MAAREGEEHSVRLKAIREATGLTQLQFLERLNSVAKKLGTRPYVQSLLSRLENGLQVPSFDDITVYATVDPKARGKLWLAWNETEDATLQRYAGVRDIPVEAMQKVAEPKPAPRKRANDR
jgi:transcriptional regulator with XRE-family HTH domain